MNERDAEEMDSTIHQAEEAGIRAALRYVYPGRDLPHLDAIVHEIHCQLADYEARKAIEGARK